MNYIKSFLPHKGQLKGLWWIVVLSILFTVSNAEHYSDACRSIHGRMGTCVPLAVCPLFSGWLKVRPLIRENIRMLVKYTCFFDIKNPKVCCPNDNLYAPSQEEEEDPFAIRLGPAPVRRGISSISSPKLVFPEPVISTSFEEQKREHVPLYFPTDQNSHAAAAIHQNEPSSISIWNTGEKTGKDGPIVKKDLRHHPNFRLIPKLHECGNPRKLDSQINTYGAYPWIALIGVKRRRSLDFDHICAGGIINDRYILTSAHCFSDGRAKPKYVRLGEYDLDTLIDQGSIYLPQSRREDYRIEKMTVHPDYNPTTGANDIALIRIERPVALNTTFIQAICLPFATEYGIENRLEVNRASDLDGKAAWVAGWSRHSWDGLYSTGLDYSKLRESFVDFTPHEKCRQDYPNLSPFSSRTQFCVGGKGKRNSCVPDSGGPLMYPTKVPAKTEGFMEAKFFMLGLLSRGPTGNVCQTVRAPEDEDDEEEASRLLPTSVYTRVSKYLTWILNNMQE